MSVDRWRATTADARGRDRSTVAELAEAEPLLALPAASFPAEAVLGDRTVAANASVTLDCVNATPVDWRDTDDDPRPSIRRGGVEPEPRQGTLVYAMVIVVSHAGVPM